MTESKKCTKCEKLLSLDNYSKTYSSVGSNNLRNVCKRCVNVRIDKKHKIKRSNLTQEKLELLRAKDRERYIPKIRTKKLKQNKNTYDREAYSIIKKKHDLKYPEKRKARSLSCKKISIEKGMNRHHWSYNESDYLDVIILSTALHNKLHKLMYYDQSKMMYRLKENDKLLDSKQSHLDLL